MKIICSIKRLTNAVRDHRPYRHAQLWLALIAILDFAAHPRGSRGNSIGNLSKKRSAKQEACNPTAFTRLPCLGLICM